MRALRITLLVILGIVVLAAVAFEIARRSWLGRQAAARVAAYLQSSLGTTVRVADVNIGLGGSSVRGLQVFEPGRDNAPPWVTVEDTQADVSAWDLVQGRTEPHVLTLAGARVTLRFDRHGHLLTRLPSAKGGAGALPEIHIRHGELTIDQEGHPAMMIEGIDADLRPEADGLTASGAVTDGRWGHWSVRGRLDRRNDTGSATLSTERVHVTQMMLTELPFVPPSVWREVQLEGDTPVEFTLRTASSGTPSYRVDLHPEATHVQVPSIGLDADQAQGGVTVEDNRVRLERVKGRAAGGEIRTGGDLDFREPTSHLKFDVQVDRLDVAQLPRSWSLPPKIEGRLTGQADLAVTIPPTGPTRLDGHGEGVIREARVAGQPAEPIRLELHADRERLRFTAQARPRDADRRVALAAAGLTAVAFQAPAADEHAFLPTAVVNQSVNAVRRWVGAAGDTASRALARLPRPAKPAARTIDVNLAMRNVDLAEFVKGLGVRVPFPVTGRLTFRVHAAIPLDSPHDIKAYRVDGTAELPTVSLAGFDMRDVRGAVTFREGVLRLEELTGRVPSIPEAPGGSPGTFRGTAELQLEPLGDLTARLAVDRVPIDRILAMMPDAAGRARGNLSGTLDARAPAKDFSRPEAWRATGRLRVDRLAGYSLAIENVGGEIRLELGTLTISNLTGRLAGATLSGGAELALQTPYPYHANLQTSRADLSLLNRLPPQERPPVSLAGHAEVSAQLSGTLRPWALRARGAARASDLRVETFTLTRLGFDWSAEADRLALSRIDGRLYGGRVTGQATLPLRPAAPGSADLAFKDLGLADLERDLPSLPVRVEGRADGTIRANLPAAGARGKRRLAARLDLKAPQLRVQGIPAERLHGSVDYAGNAVDYRLQGETLGGTFDLNGSVPTGDPKAEERQGGHGLLTVRGARLSRLGPALGGASAMAPLRGSVDVDLTFRQERFGDTPAGEGNVTVRRLRWGEAELSPFLRARVALRDGTLRIEEVVGRLGGGQMSGGGAATLDRGLGGTLRLEMRGAQAAQLLAPWPSLASTVRGTVDVRLRTTLGRTWYGEGQLSLVRGQVAGVEVAEWLAPLNFQISPGGGGRLEIRDSTASAAQGRLTGDATYDWGAFRRLDGRVTFNQLDLAALTRQATGSSRVGAGRVTGRFDFSSLDPRSLNDLTGNLTASLQETQAFQFPILQSLAPYIAPGQSSATFTSGDLRARLGGGALQVQRMTVQGRTLQLYAEGRVQLEPGRLDLDVTANPGRIGPPVGLIRRLGLRIPLTGAVPAALLLQATDALSNSLVRLRVMGTVRNPVITIQPLGALGEAAVRFFLLQSNVPLP